MIKNSKLLLAGKSGLAAVAMIALAIFAYGGADVSAEEPAATLSTFMVFADGVEGREVEFNNWYENTHLGEVLQVPGFVSAQRFVILGEPEGQKYVAVYEIEGDPQAALTALYAAVAKTMNMSDSMDGATVVTKLYTPRTAKMSAQ